MSQVEIAKPSLNNSIMAGLSAWFKNSALGKAIKGINNTIDEAEKLLEQQARIDAAIKHFAPGLDTI